VAAALGLAGARVRMVGAVGADAPWPLEHLRARHVDTTGVHESPNVPTGRAFIQISAADGENSIVLLKGANFAHTAEQDDPAHWLQSGVTHMVLQNEIPLETTMAFARHAAVLKTSGDAARRVCTVFNPSPMPTADELRAFPWDGIDVLVVNEGEEHDLLQALDAGTAAPALATLPAMAHVPWLVVTRGGRGSAASVLIDGERTSIEVPAARARAVVDTTGAGDTFSGYLVAALMAAHDEPLTRAVAESVLRRASLAAAMAVESHGAMDSIPSAADVDART